MKNLWHDISIGKNVPEEFNCIIEIPKGSQNKYEIDKETGLMMLARANYNSAPFPFDYGFVPQTLWDDGDPLDVVLLSTFPIQMGVLVSVRPIAIMDMNDSGEGDAKIIAVPMEDRRFENVKDLKDLNEHTLKEFKHFFETYKVLKKDDQKNPVTISGYEDKASAIKAIKHSQELYSKKFGK